MSATWSPGNDNFLLIADDEDDELPVQRRRGIRNAITGNLIVGATGSALIVKASDGSALAGTGFTNPITLAEVAGRPGVYAALSPKEAPLVHGEGVVARWTIEGPGGESAYGEKEITVATRT